MNKNKDKRGLAMPVLKQQTQVSIPSYMGD